MGRDLLQNRNEEHHDLRYRAGLAVDDDGECDDRPPLVLIHGLTFDRRMWRPALNELHRIDPRRRVLSLDLPGHGQSPRLASHDIESVTSAVHQAADEAQLHFPVVVGHSIGASIASVYAGRYPSRGVVNVDQPLQIAPFVQLVRSLADKLRGPDFPTIWNTFAASMHIELLPSPAQDLLYSTCRPQQDLVLSYWQGAIDRPVAEVTQLVEVGLAAARAADLPYLVVTGDHVEPGYRSWLTERLPQATMEAWPGSGHFPHVAHPRRFAQCLAATAKWPASEREPYSHGVAT